VAERSIFISVPHGTSAGNMLRAGGLLTRVLIERSTSCC
jgi:hypothetical protein